MVHGSSLADCPHCALRPLCSRRRYFSYLCGPRPASGTPSNVPTPTIAASATATATAPSLQFAGSADGYTLSLTCTGSEVITSLAYVYYGTPVGGNPPAFPGACDSATAAAIISASCVGSSACSVAVSAASFGAPTAAGGSGATCTPGTQWVFAAFTCAYPAPSATPSPSSTPAAQHLVCSSTGNDAVAWLVRAGRRCDVPAARGTGGGRRGAGGGGARAPAHAPPPPFPYAAPTRRCAPRSRSSSACTPCTARRKGRCWQPTAAAARRGCPTLIATPRRRRPSSRRDACCARRAPCSSRPPPLASTQPPSALAPAPSACGAGQRTHVAHPAQVCRCAREHWRPPLRRVQRLHLPCANSTHRLHPWSALLHAVPRLHTHTATTSHLLAPLAARTTASSAPRSSRRARRHPCSRRRARRPPRRCRLAPSRCAARRSPTHRRRSAAPTAAS